MEQHIVKHNEHYLVEIGTKNNLATAVLNNVLRLEEKEAEHFQGHYVLFYPQRIFIQFISFFLSELKLNYFLVPHFEIKLVVKTIRTISPLTKQN